MFSTFWSIVLFCTALMTGSETPADVSITLTFVNHTPIPVEVYAIEEDDSEKIIQIIESGKKVGITADPLTVWRVKTQSNQAFILETTAQNYNEVVDVTLISKKVNRGLGVYVTNNTPDTLEYFWVDYKGREKSYGIIKPKRTTTIVTYETHPWFFKKLRSGELVDCIIANDSFEQRYTIDGTKKVSLPSIPKSSTNFTANIREKYMDIRYLGVAFDAAHVDPMNLSKNTVNEEALRPRVLELKPSTSTVALKGKQRYLPEGVEAQVINRFRWRDDVAWIKSAEQFKEENLHFFERTTELIQEVAMTQSESYKNIKTGLEDGKNLYIEQIGNYVSFIMTLDMMNNYELADGFKQAIAELSENANDYDRFIEKWGTHFSSEVVVGGRCAYQFEILSKSFESQDENVDLYHQFRQLLFRSMPRIKVNFNAPQNEQLVRDVADILGANKVEFITYNNDALYYDKWSKDVMNGPGLIDVQLASYLTLLNKKHFPEDVEIDAKRKLLEQAMDRYYKQFIME